MTDDQDLGKIMYELVHPENTRVLRWDQYANEYQDQWRKAATNFLAPSNKVIAEQRELLERVVYIFKPTHSNVEYEITKEIAKHLEATSND